MSEYLAALDLGSNSTKLLVARASDGGSPVEVQETIRVTRLAEAVAERGFLQAEAMARTLAAGRELLESLPRGPGSGRGVAAATSAVRDARNRDEFLAAFRGLLGAKPTVISGEEEARTAFAGATGGWPSDRAVVNVEIGGGSTEISVGRPGHCLWHRCLELGCVRVGERFSLYEIPSPGAVVAARKQVQSLLAPAMAEMAQFRPSAETAAVIASGGTATTFSALQQRVSEHSREAIHGYAATCDEVAAAMDRLFRMTSQERARLPGIMPGRAPVLPTGLLILNEVLGALGQRGFTVSVRGFRYGLILRLQQGELAPTWTW
jgi:exopolyphosphatase/guanosine-5'-triphosphate,3'-diphosphate pyrophosphatase